MHLPARATKRLISVTSVVCATTFAALLYLAAAWVSTPPAAAASPPRSAPTCATSGLVVWLDTEGSGTAGSIYYTLELTNLSGHTCTLTGYPGVSAINLAGHRLGSAASRSTAHRAAPVTLASGGTAEAVLRVVEAGNFPAASCRQTTAAGLRVYPPNPDLLV